MIKTRIYLTRGQTELLEELVHAVLTENPWPEFERFLVRFETIDQQLIEALARQATALAKAEEKL
jgi:hypothetical protein